MQDAVPIAVAQDSHISGFLNADDSNRWRNEVQSDRPIAGVGERKSQHHQLILRICRFVGLQLPLVGVLVVITGVAWRAETLSGYHRVCDELEGAPSMSSSNELRPWVAKEAPR